MEWIVVILIRLLVPLLILRFQLAGSLLAIIADNLDVVIVDYLGVKDFRPYNQIDKSLDTYFALIQGYTILFWKNKIAKSIGFALLTYRLIGVIIYELTNLRVLLLIFPNIFLPFYIGYLAIIRFSKKDLSKSYRAFIPLLVVVTVYKLAHEYMLHIAQFPIYSVIKNTFLP